MSTENEHDEVFALRLDRVARARRLWEELRQQRAGGPRVAAMYDEVRMAESLAREAGASELDLALASARTS